MLPIVKHELLLLHYEPKAGTNIPGKILVILCQEVWLNRKTSVPNLFACSTSPLKEPPQVIPNLYDVSSVKVKEDWTRQAPK